MIYQNSNFRVDIPFTKKEKTLIEKTAREAGLTVENFIRLRLIMSDRICFASKSDRSTAIEATMTMLQSNLSFISEHNGDSSWAGKLNPQIVLNAVGLIQHTNEFDDRIKIKVHTAIKENFALISADKTDDIDLENSTPEDLSKKLPSPSECTEKVSVSLDNAVLDYSAFCDTQKSCPKYLRMKVLVPARTATDSLDHCLENKQAALKLTRQYKNKKINRYNADSVTNELIRLSYKSVLDYLSIVSM